jgi:hypothetical protein
MASQTKNLETEEEVSGGGGGGFQPPGLHKWSNDSKNRLDNKNLSMKCGDSYCYIQLK